MSFQTDRSYTTCPVCGAELELDETDTYTVICCPKCSFRIERPRGETDEAAQALEREEAKEPNDYSTALDKEEPPGEDPMLEYREL